MEHDEAKALLTSYLNRRMRVVISDGRVMDGQFLCTDSDRNMVLGSCEEFFSEEEIAELESSTVSAASSRQSRTLGLVIVPGAHIVSISLAEPHPPSCVGREEATLEPSSRDSLADSSSTVVESS